MIHDLIEGPSFCATESEVCTKILTVFRNEDK
jgi:hypothetical protein